jgi:thiol-disulfide isomerase/thioredoxin
MKKRIALAALALAMSAAGIAVQPAKPQQAAPAAKAKPVADPQMVDAQGFLKLVEQYKGKPLLVNFWATWCEPCRAEYPLLNDLAKEYGPQGLKVVGVSLDQDGDLILMRRFLARYKPVFPNYRKKEGGEAEFIQAVLPGWNGAIPATVFYGKDGTQIGHLLGGGNRETFEVAIHKLLEK